MNDSPRPTTPLWFTILIVIVALPAFSFPSLLATCPPDLKAMVWIYPIYIIAAAWLEWQSYPQRHAIAWILLVLSAISHPAIWYLANTPQ